MGFFIKQISKKKMYITEEIKKKIKSKISKLNEIREQLKTEFIGLDSVIDEVTDLIEPWYLFPESQIRPTIINLWGMTGVGKTSLVVRMFELLNINTVYKYDVGDFCGDDSESKLKYKISNDITKLSDDDMFVLVFDEFQLGRTIDADGNEIDRAALRILWELYDTGKIELINGSYNTSRMFILSQKLEECVNNNVIVTDGVVSGNIDFFHKVFGVKPPNIPPIVGEVDDDDDDDDDNLFIPKYFHYTIKDVWGGRFSFSSDINRYLCSLNEKEILTFILETLEVSIKPTIYDFSNSVIFNIGNLDEAYKLANDVNPDSDADFLYEYTNKITLPQIKQSLMKRYRPEQIARLGNNHVIYKSFNQDMYKELIKFQVEKFKIKILEKFGLTIDCDESVYTILYSEGVFPTQGTRPVFSTITSLIDSYIGKIISDIIKQDQLDVVKLSWKYSNENYYFNFIDNKGDILFKKKYPVLLKTESLRVNTKDDIQALVALHEAGHAICGMMSIGILPKHVVSKTADSNAGGFCVLETPKYQTAKLLRGHIIYSLGGYAAEKLVFGKDSLTSGSYSDIEVASGDALIYVKGYGMNGDPMHFSAKSSQTVFSKADQDIIDSDRQALTLIKDAVEEATSILNRESNLLYEVANYLSENSRMTSEQLKEYHDKYAVQKIDFKTKENYYNFKEILGKLK